MACSDVRYCKTLLILWANIVLNSVIFQTMHSHQGYRVSFALIEALQEKIKELPRTATTYKVAWIVDLDVRSRTLFD
jgi:hypothetical protein